MLGFVATQGTDAIAVGIEASGQPSKKDMAEAQSCPLPEVSVPASPLGARAASSAAVWRPREGFWGAYLHVSVKNADAWFRGNVQEHVLRKPRGRVLVENGDSLRWPEGGLAISRTSHAALLLRGRGFRVPAKCSLESLRHHRCLSSLVAAAAEGVPCLHVLDSVDHGRLRHKTRSEAVYVAGGRGGAVVKGDQDEVGEKGSGEEVPPVGHLQEAGEHREEVTPGNGWEVPAALFGPAE